MLSTALLPQRVGKLACIGDACLRVIFFQLVGALKQENLLTKFDTVKYLEKGFHTLLISTQVHSHFMVGQEKFEICNFETFFRAENGDINLRHISENKDLG